MKSIIYTDRNSASLEVYKRIISQQGFKVRTCNSGLDILMVIESDPVDLVILDLGMPDVSEMSICTLLKRHSCNDQLAILIICDSQQGKEFLSKLPDGADNFIVRPFETKDLISKIPVTIAKVEAKVKIAKLKARCISKKDLGEFPEQVGQYKILARLGEGANSIVFRAINNSDEKTEEVALKVFNVTAYQHVDTSFDAFFLREAYGLSKLRHPNIVKMLDFGKIENTYFLVMELVKGRSLESIVEKEGAIKEDRLITIAHQMSLVFQYLEEQNVVHRDIKPGNVLVCTKDSAKLTDFGAAKQRDDITLTKMNEHFMGTPQFVSPEQIMAEKCIDIRCDIYSLGATLYFCGTKTMPFTGANVIEILDNNLNETPPAMKELDPRISSDFSFLVTKMLEKDKEKRITAKELNQSLESMAKKKSTPIRRVKITKKAKKK